MVTNRQEDWEKKLAKTAKEFNDKLQTTLEKKWPGTKTNIQKMSKEAQKIFRKGEGEIKKISKKSSLEVQKISLQLKREAACLKLGESVAKVERSQWSKHKKIGSLLTQIKKYDQNIEQLKKRNKKIKLG